MNPRRLNCLIHLLNPVELIDQETGQGTTTFRHHHRKVASSREDVSGGTNRRGLQVESSVTTIFTIRYIADLTVDFQVEIYKEGGGGRVMEIASMLDRDGDSQWLELHCSGVV